MLEYAFSFAVRHSPHQKGSGRLVFNRDEPFVARFRLTLEEQETEWVCDIDLLKQVLSGYPAGLGDLQLYTQPHNPTQLILYLAGEGGYIELILKKSDVARFYSMTYVPQAERFFRVNSALDKILDDIFS
jgi:hypothetical protein